MRLFLLMVIVTSIEVVLIAQIGSILGFWLTLFIIILTALIGSKLLKHQWAHVFQSNHMMKQGVSKSLMEAVLLLICGVLLVTPGFLTDIIGFLMLMPKFRTALIHWIENKGLASRFTQKGFSFKSNKTQPNQNDILEGEYTRHDDE